MTKTQADEILRRRQRREPHERIAKAVKISKPTCIAFCKRPLNRAIDPWKCPDCGGRINLVICLHCHPELYESFAFGFD